MISSPLVSLSMAMNNPQCEQFSGVLSQLLEKQRQEEDQILHVFVSTIR
jgi:hypothetical protein